MNIIPYIFLTITLIIIFHTCLLIGAYIAYKNIETKIVKFIYHIYHRHRREQQPNCPSNWEISFRILREVLLESREKDIKYLCKLWNNIDNISEYDDNSPMKILEQLINNPDNTILRKSFRDKVDKDI